VKEEDKEVEQEEGGESEEEQEDEPVSFTVGEKVYTDSTVLAQEMSNIIHTKYALGSYLTGFDKELALALLERHPDATAKKGSGVSEIAVTLHPAFHNRCLMVVRTDGTTEDFSVGKCIDIVFNKIRDDSKGHRVLIPKAVIRFDLSLTPPPAPADGDKEGASKPSYTEARNAVREALTEALAKIDNNAVPPAILDLDLEFDGTRKMQLVLMQSEERATLASEKLPGECAEGICASIEKACGWKAVIDRVAVAEGAEEKIYWERRIAEKERHRRSGRGGRGGAHHRGGGRGGGIKRNFPSSRGGKSRNDDRQSKDRTLTSSTETKILPAVKPSQPPAVQARRDVMTVTNGVSDLQCRPTAGQTWRQTTSVGCCGGGPPVVGLSRKRPRVAPK